MEITELRPQVAEALVLAMDGNLSKRRSQEILTTVLAFLDQQIETDLRRRATDETTSTAQLTRAVKALSYSEVGAMTALFAELGSYEGILVASKVADEAGVTRSVIVNALSKLESAGVVKSQSLGAKGTHIKILRPEIVDLIKAVA